MISILLYILYILMWIYDGIIFISIILTWIPNVFQYKLPRTIRYVSDWYMAPFRGILVVGILDLTPIIGLVLYNFIMQAVAGLIF